MMKSAVTSTDIYFLTEELKSSLLDARIDKVYQISERELKIKTRRPGHGSSELVIAPNYLCVTRYKRDAPEQPSSFAMQLRKHLKGAYISDIRQHGFDRIVEFELQGLEKTYVLVSEFFSKGNVILCDSEKKILGLLEWQKWKDRRLGVGQVYDYPPGGANPLDLTFEAFEKTLKSSKKKIASSLATDIGLGGVYAEEACLMAGIEKEQASGAVADLEALFGAVESILERINLREKKPAIVLEGETYADVLPFQLRVYGGYDVKEYESFNDAVDTYFSEASFSEKQDLVDLKVKEKIAKIRRIEESQEKTVSELFGKADEYRRMGDTVYQNMAGLEKLMEAIELERKKGKDWGEIREIIAGKEFMGLRILDLSDATIKLEEVGQGQEKK